MPGLIQESLYKHITIKELAPTFVAEIGGVDFSRPVEPEVFQEIKDALAKGNGLWHVDSSFQPRRASYSLLLAHTLPPPGTGGSTMFADTRTAYENLPQDLKTQLEENDYICAHSLFHSRKMGSPEYFKDLNPLDYKMTQHKLLQKHEPSGRKNLYIARHAHHIEEISPEKSDELLDELIGFATQGKFVCEVEWEQKGDLIIWDNTCVMHRSTGGSFEGVHMRDMRRTTVHDGSSTAWGLNDVGDRQLGFVDPVVAKAVDTKAR